LTTDSYVTLYLNDQHGRRLREEAAAHALSRRVRRAERTRGRSWWQPSRRRMRAPAIP
jgi:hypothetical protein